MSAKDDAHGGRFEPARKPAPGPGMPVTSACDECGARGLTAGRRRTKVLRGPLRGMVGNVCSTCMALREKAPA